MSCCTARYCRWSATGSRAAARASACRRVVAPSLAPNGPSDTNSAQSVAGVRLTENPHKPSAEVSGKKSSAAFSACAATWTFVWPPPAVSAIEPDKSITTSVRFGRPAAVHARNASDTRSGAGTFSGCTDVAATPCSGAAPVSGAPVASRRPASRIRCCA